MFILFLVIPISEIIRRRKIRIIRWMKHFFPNQYPVTSLSSNEECNNRHYPDGGCLHSVDSMRTFLVPSCFQKMMLISVEIRSFCLIIVKYFVMSNPLNIQLYPQHVLGWTKYTSLMCTWSVSATDPLMTACNVLIKDLITSNKPVLVMATCK